MSFDPQPLSSLWVLGLLSLAPFAAVMLTCFSKLAVVLSLARTALGSQHAPPTAVLTGLAAVLSAYVMAPVAEGAWRELRAAGPEVGLETLARAGAPLREFLIRHGDPAERARLVELGRELHPKAAPLGEASLAVVVPAFVLTELREAFQLGFLVFLPFLAVELVVANVLLALGMQTLSPGQVSLPFKLLLFAAVDGWSLLARGLIAGYR
jgi:type III secretion protein R